MPVLPSRKEPLYEKEPEQEIMNMDVKNRETDKKKYFFTKNLLL
jgi:hypothetical protein